MCYLCAMTNKTKLILGGAVIGVALVVWLIIWAFGTSIKNKEQDLRQLVIAQQNSNKANFDKMFKVIQQIAEVTDQAKETFKEIYPSLIEGRYSQDKNLLSKWVVESNPQFDFKLYSRLIDAIERNREEFFNQQNKLISYSAVHTSYIKKWPGNLYFGPNDTIAITIITSKITKETFQTGEENDIDLFNKK